ncbi:MAG: hypothetical protein IJP56_09535 [Synergistaceae bacterium]|nr:hypothetical protein [Synergistaceae bacterium]
MEEQEVKSTLDIKDIMQILSHRYPFLMVDRITEFDDNHAVAAGDEFVEDAEEAFDVVGVEAGGGFVDDVEGFASGAAGEFGGEFDALGFAAGEGGGGLAELDVAEADLLEGFEFVVDGREVFEEVASFVDGHVEDFGNVFVFVFYFERNYKYNQRNLF